MPLTDSPTLTGAAGPYGKNVAGYYGRNAAHHDADMFAERLAKVKDLAQTDDAITYHVEVSPKETAPDGKPTDAYLDNFVGHAHETIRQNDGAQKGATSFGDYVQSFWKALGVPVDTSQPDKPVLDMDFLKKKFKLNGRPVNPDTINLMVTGQRMFFDTMDRNQNDQLDLAETAAFYALQDDPQHILLDAMEDKLKGGRHDGQLDFEAMRAEAFTRLDGTITVNERQLTADMMIIDPQQVGIALDYLLTQYNFENRPGFEADSGKSPLE